MLIQARGRKYHRGALAGVRNRGLLIRGALAIGLCGALGACAHALKGIPPFVQVVGGAQGHSAAEVDALLARGEALLRRWDAASVKEAAAVWSTAAAADPGRIEGLVGVVRAGIWMTEHEPDAVARKEASTRAVQAAQWCAKIAREDPACSYWLGAALGVQARERPSTGLSALPAIRAAFERAAAANPSLEEGGPDRALALLYLRAPGWPTGPGDPALGLEHARKALALKPDYPPNHLALGEALAATGDPEGSRAAYERARELAGSRKGEEGPEAAEWVSETERALGPDPKERAR